jgi:serine-type D-Ala-D-Ala carboxypeptidase/endopeptidase
MKRSLARYDCSMRMKAVLLRRLWKLEHINEFPDLAGNAAKPLGRRPAVRVLANCLVLSLLMLLLPAVTVCGGNPTPDMAGTWAGTLKVGQSSLRLALHLTSSAAGLAAKLDSLDQGAMGIPCTDVTLEGEIFSFQVPSVGGSYKGALAAGGETIVGTWTQSGMSLPLTFTHLAKGAKLAPTPGMVPGPARSPVSLANLQPVLEREFAPVLKNGVLAPSTGGGLVIGVLDHGHRRIFAFGTAHPDSIFEIGSVTKTFTALALAQMVEQKKVALDNTVCSLLPSASIPKPNGPCITLVDLATQHSGLPRMPTNFDPKNVADPYADYHAAQLYTFLDQHGLAVPPHVKYLYSNLGFGLLGFVLASRAGVPYGQLIHSEVTGPLRLKDTTIVLSPEQHERFIQGHDAANAPVGPWHLDALAGCSALRSTAADLLTYLDAQLHPAKFAPVDQLLGSRSPAATLPAAIGLTHRLLATGPPGMRIGLAWMYVLGTGVYWHNGGTGGYSSFAMFSSKDDRAIVVLYNREDIGSGPIMFVERVDANVNALMSGKPALPLE